MRICREFHDFGSAPAAYSRIVGVVVPYATSPSNESPRQNEPRKQSVHQLFGEHFLVSRSGSDCQSHHGASNVRWETLSFIGLPRHGPLTLHQRIAFASASSSFRRSIIFTSPRLYAIIPAFCKIPALTVTLERRLPSIWERNSWVSGQTMNQCGRRTSTANGPGVLQLREADCRQRSG